MKGEVAIGILFCGFICNLAVMADDAVPSNWLLRGHGKQYDLMFSRGTTEITGPNTRRVWHKIVYKAPQQSSRGQYQSEVVLVELDCTQHTVALVRDRRYSEDGSLQSDTVTPESQLRRINYYKKLPLDALGATIQKIGLTDDDDVCRTAD